MYAYDIAGGEKNVFSLWANVFLPEPESQTAPTGSRRSRIWAAAVVCGNDLFVLCTALVLISDLGVGSDPAVCVVPRAGEKIKEKTRKEILSRF